MKVISSHAQSHDEAGASEFGIRNSEFGMPAPCSISPLEAERDRFFNLSADLLCVAGFDGQFKRVNPSWERNLGYPASHLQSLPILEFVHPDDRDLTIQYLERLACTSQPVLFENRFRRHDGSYLLLQWNATPLPEQKLIYASARDVTDRRRAELEIQKLAAFPRLPETSRRRARSLGTPGRAGTSLVAVWVAIR